MAFLYMTVLLLVVAGLTLHPPPHPRQDSPVPFLQQIDNQTWIIGNELWNLTQHARRGAQLYYKGHDCVGHAAGHMVSYGGSATNATPYTQLTWTGAAVVAAGVHADSAAPWIDVAFAAAEGALHWVVSAGLAGAHQYFVASAGAAGAASGLPAPLGELRTVWRLDNATFSHARTGARDEPLPPLAQFVPANKVQDETWRDGAGGFLTKYDYAAFVRAQTAYGVYGNGFGSWYIHAGKDYYNGNHLKQELMMHRESSTGDVVQLNMIHGPHFMASSADEVPAGKMWGPWLWYLNDGDVNDAEARAEAEVAAWPYEWLGDEAYHARGCVSGRLLLSDGRPASNAAVFLGDNAPNKTALDMGSTYYYTSYADAEGNFQFDLVREGVYGLQAWSNGSAIADVNTQFLLNGVEVAANKITQLGVLDWAVSSKTQLFRVGDFDRYAYGFQYGGAPRTHGLVDNCPADLLYTVGSSEVADWCFGQTHKGNWTIAFEVAGDASASGSTATLIVSLAAYSTGTSADIYVNGQNQVGNLTSGTPSLLSDPGLYRSATLAGEWRYFEFPFEADLLSSGWNSVTFQVTRNKTWHGMMWDSIILEW